MDARSRNRSDKAKRGDGPAVLDSINCLAFPFLGSYFCDLLFSDDPFSNGELDIPIIE